MMIINTSMFIMIVIIISFFYTFQVSRYKASLAMQKMREMLIVMNAGDAEDAWT